MKQHYFFTAILLAFTSISSFAQSSFQISDAGWDGAAGFYVNTEVQIAPAQEQDLEWHCVITNVGNDTVDLRVHREIIYSDSGHQNYFCIGAACYPSFVDTSQLVHIVEMAPQQTDSTFRAHLKPKEVEGITEIKYCLWDNDNPADSLCFTVTFDIDPVGLGEHAGKATLNAPYPNPSSHNVTVDYDISNAVARREIALTDLSGRVLSSERLEAANGTHQLDVSDLPQGIYLLQIVLDGEAVTTKKITVTH